MESLDIPAVLFVLKTYGPGWLAAALLAYLVHVLIKARFADMKEGALLSTEQQKANNESNRKLAEAIDRMARSIEDRNRVSAELMMGYQALVSVTERSLAVQAERDRMIGGRFDELLRVVGERRRVS